LMIAASLDAFTFEEVVESRYALGEMCCRLAAESRTEDDIEVLRTEIATQRHKKLTDVEFCASDVRFHVGLARATHNTIISVLAAGAIEGLEPITNLMLYRFRARQVLSDQHESLVECLVARDADGMAKVLQAQKEYLVEKQVEAKTWRTTRNKST
jgi:GntR family transcriptional regulator, transcriptional repressor for pyruvate dehydrogenase complex